MKNRLLIKQFVQNVLGCKCPDRVFEQVEDNQVLPSASPHTRSIMIGGRLLVYVWEVDGIQDVQKGLPAMLEAGKKERDTRGLNRFRAVLVTGTPQIIEPNANLCFSLFKDRDDRMHIHIVAQNDLRGV